MESQLFSFSPVPGKSIGQKIIPDRDHPPPCLKCSDRPYHHLYNAARLESLKHHLIRQSQAFSQNQTRQLISLLIFLPWNVHHFCRVKAQHQLLNNIKVLRQGSQASNSLLTSKATNYETVKTASRRAPIDRASRSALITASYSATLLEASNLK